MLARPALRGWSHVLAFLLVAPLGLVVLALTEASAARRLSVAVYLAGMLTMFGTSALYHVGRWTVRELLVWRRLDHSAIFLAIAGSYTPVSVAGLDGWQRTTTLAVVWGGAAVGIGAQWLPVTIPRSASTIAYIVVGWSIAPSLLTLAANLGWFGTGLLAAGGVAYSLGAVAYATARPDPWPRVFGYHEVFHACTVAGAACHFAVVALVVVPAL